MLRLHDAIALLHAELNRDPYIQEVMLDATDVIEHLRATIPTPEEGQGVHVENGLRILLQLAVDEMLHMVEAVDHNHETKLDHLKYGTPYGAVNGLRKVREDILVQAAMWGIALSPHRTVPTPEEGTEPAGRLEGGLEAAISQPGRSEKSPQGGAGAAVSSSTQPSADAAEINEINMQSIRKRERDLARRADAAGEWVLVPREPHFRQVVAGRKALDRRPSERVYGLVEELYRAMLAASPSPTWGDEQVERAVRVFHDHLFVSELSNEDIAGWMHAFALALSALQGSDTLPIPRHKV